jgi:hypothetical protein
MEGRERIMSRSTCFGPLSATHITAESNIDPFSALNLLGEFQLQGFDGRGL